MHETDQDHIIFLQVLVQSLMQFIQAWTIFLLLHFPINDLSISCREEEDELTRLFMTCWDQASPRSAWLAAENIRHYRILVAHALASGEKFRIWAIQHVLISLVNQATWLMTLMDKKTIKEFPNLYYKQGEIWRRFNKISMAFFSQDFVTLEASVIFFWKDHGVNSK